MSDYNVQHTLWTRRLANANKFHDEWEGKYRCSSLEDYKKGFQWKLRGTNPSNLNYRPYTLNLFHAELSRKLASTFIQKPKFLVSPKPDAQALNIFNQDQAVQAAGMKQDFLNTIIGNKNMNFTKHLRRVYKDSFSRFGILEIGYAADWRNPQKLDPYMKSWEDADVTEEQDKVIENIELPENERMFVKRINPKRFRVAVSEAIDLNDHDWCGYYDFYYTKTLKNTKGIKWPDDGPSSDNAARNGAGDVSIIKDRPEFLRMLDEGDISKVWRIWDQVSHKEKLLLESNMDEPLWEESFERFPFKELRWDENYEGFYPIPPFFQWQSSQDEVNEAKEQLRSYRRRFTAKYWKLKDAIEAQEEDKFISGPDGSIVEVKQKDALGPIENPAIGPVNAESMQVSMSDFNLVTGSMDSPVMADRETATKAKIVSTQNQVRMNFEQLDFNEYLCGVGMELYTQAKERLGGLMIKRILPQAEEALTFIQQNPAVWQYVTNSDLSDGYDIDIDIDIENATPAAKEQESQSFFQFVAFLQNYPMVAMSPVLIREAAYRCNYRNEKVIAQMQQVALASMLAKQQQEQLNSGKQATPVPGDNNVAKAAVAQSTPPTLDRIKQQQDAQTLLQ